MASLSNKAQPESLNHQWWKGLLEHFRSIQDRHEKVRKDHLLSESAQVPVDRPKPHRELSRTEESPQIGMEERKSLLRRGSSGTIKTRKG
jgi:hypothetical protein